MYRIVECEEQNLNKSIRYFEIDRKKWFRWKTIKSRDGFTLKFKDIDQAIVWINAKNNFSGLASQLDNRDYVMRKIVEQF
jgi:hypothetical protein